MKILTTIILTALLTVIVFAQTGSNSTQNIVYEYKFEYAPNEKKANELGSQGWELVAIQSPSQNIVASTYVFKRAKK